MATIRFHQTTNATPEQFVAGLTDFGPGRSKLFKNSDDAYLKVHNLGPNRAEVTEGSGGVWERLYYDWTDPHHVQLKTIDSNLFGGASGHTYTLTPQADGTTAIDVVLVREGKNLRGLVVAGVLGTIGKRSLAKAFAGSVEAIEARSNAGSAQPWKRVSLPGAHTSSLAADQSRAGLEVKLRGWSAGILD